jgi:hypothetical protein
VSTADMAVPTGMLAVRPTEAIAPLPGPTDTPALPVLMDTLEHNGVTPQLRADTAMAVSQE